MDFFVGGTDGEKMDQINKVSPLFPLHLLYWIDLDPELAAQRP